MLGRRTQQTARSVLGSSEERAEAGVFLRLCEQHKKQNTELPFNASESRHSRHLHQNREHTSMFPILVCKDCEFDKTIKAHVI